MIFLSESTLMIVLLGNQVKVQVGGAERHSLSSSAEKAEQVSSDDRLSFSSPTSEEVSWISCSQILRRVRVVQSSNHNTLMYPLPFKQPNFVMLKILCLAGGESREYGGLNFGNFTTSRSHIFSSYRCGDTSSRILSTSSPSDLSFLSSMSTSRT